MLQTVDWDKEPSEQLENLRKFDNLPQEQYDELTSGKYIKYDEAAMVMEYLPAERLLPNLYSLLVHLQDSNWPAASRVSRLLVSIGAPVLPEIKRVFREDKTDWIWLANIIGGVVKKWDNTSVIQLKRELIEIVGYADNEGASVAALEALHKVLPPSEFQSLYQRLREQYSGNASLTEDLDYVFEK